MLNKPFLYLSILWLSLFSGHIAAAPGPLFMATATPNTLTITPTVPNQMYPSMGIQMLEGPSVTGCIPHGNGFCLFSAQADMPATLSFQQKASTALRFTVCLNGQANLSCQTMTLANPSDRCRAGGTCRVFVTPANYDGNLGGINGANAICNALAKAYPPPDSDSNPISQKGFAAWLSTNATHAKDNIQLPASSLDAPEYVKYNSRTVIIARGSQLPWTPLDAPINETPNPSATPATTVWTNSFDTGIAVSVIPATSCSDFTNNANSLEGVFGGVMGFTTTLWTRAPLRADCDNTLGLYCFEVPEK